MDSPQTEKGFIRIATGSANNDLLTALVGAELGGCELSIALFVIRKTWGWNKKMDKISITQFQKATGKSRRTVINALNELVQKTILVRNASGVEITEYGFNKNFNSWLVKKNALVQKTPSTSAENCQTLVQKTAPTKETITKDTITIREALNRERRKLIEKKVLRS